MERSLAMRIKMAREATGPLLDSSHLDVQDAAVQKESRNSQAVEHVSKVFVTDEIARLFNEDNEEVRELMIKDTCGQAQNSGTVLSAERKQEQAVKSRIENAR